MDHERIIYIYDYLSRYTDENHYVSISQIQEHLANVCNLTLARCSCIWLIDTRTPRQCLQSDQGEERNDSP